MEKEEFEKFSKEQQEIIRQEALTKAKNVITEKDVSYSKAVISVFISMLVAIGFFSSWVMVESNELVLNPSDIILIAAAKVFGLGTQLGGMFSNEILGWFALLFVVFTVIFFITVLARIIYKQIN
jgi:hypothetical protein